MNNIVFIKLYFYCLKIIAAIRAFYFKIAPKSKAPKTGLSVGLVGCGNFARYAYLPAFNRNKMSLIVSGLYSNSCNSSKKTQRMFKYETRVFPGYEELLHSGIKGIILTLPNHLHYQYIIKALESGVDVFCEKPVTSNLSDCLKLKKYLENSGRILMVGFNQRYSERISKIKNFLENSGLGKVYEVAAYHNQNIAKRIIKSPWLADAQKSGGGVLYNAGIHLVNLMLYFFGPIEYAAAKLESRKIPASFGEDTADCDFYFTSGVKGRLAASYVNGVNSSYEHLVIKGSGGMLYTDMKTSRIIFKPEGVSRWDEIRCKKETVAGSVFNELSHFYNCMEKRVTPQTEIVDSLNTLTVLEAAYLSSRERRKVPINEVIAKYALK